MNANELADELINWYSKVNLCVASAITLRQQAKEIEQLKLNLRRELSDEDIEEIAKPLFRNMENDSWYGEAIGIPDYSVCDFARAIIKASRGDK